MSAAPGRRAAGPITRSTSLRWRAGSNARATGFRAPISKRCLSPSAKTEDDVAAGGARHHRRCARARRRGAGRTDQRFDSADADGRDAAFARRRDRRRRERSAAQDALAAIDTAATRIEAYHRRQLPQDERFTDETGAKLGWRWTPLDSVGLYVPGGTACYPSSVLMNAIPARVAGVARIVMVTPASGGAINPLVLAAARRAGVSEIYRIGGAQAVAALAYGTATIAPVDKIVGPGNA